MKKEIVRMFIPIIGIWYLFKQLDIDFHELNWFDISEYGVPAALFFSFYQIILTFVIIYYLFPAVLN